MLTNKYFIIDLYNNYFFDRVAEKSDTWLHLWDIIDSVNGKELTTSTDGSKLLQEKDTTILKTKASAAG